LSCRVPVYPVNTIVILISNCS